MGSIRRFLPIEKGVFTKSETFQMAGDDLHDLIELSLVFRNGSHLKLAIIGLHFAATKWELNPSVIVFALRRDAVAKVITQRRKVARSVICLK